MAFETSEDKREELKAIVEWARMWEFPMGGRGVLSTKKNSDSRAGETQNAELGDVKTWEWRGKQVHWSNICPYCIGNTCIRTGPAEGKNGDQCRERRELKERGEGPMLVVMELEWKLRGLLEGEERTFDGDEEVEENEEEDGEDDSDEDGGDAMWD